MNAISNSPYVISGKERRKLKKELSLLKYHYKMFWYYEDVDRVMGSSNWSDLECQKFLIEKRNAITGLEYKLNMLKAGQTTGTETQATRNEYNFQLDDIVLLDNYGSEKFKVVGIRSQELEVEGDFSGGTHNLVQTSWVPRSKAVFLMNLKWKIEYDSKS